MRWWLLGVVALSLACAGLGAEPPVEEVPVEVVEAVHTGDAVAADGTGDTAAPEAPAPPTRSKQRKAKARGPRPPREPRAPPALRPEPAPKKAKKSPTPGPVPAGLEQVGPTSWRVTRALVTHWQDDPYRLGNVKEHDPGWELLGVRTRDSYHLGMRNKDVVVQVNGHKLNTMPQLMSTYLFCKNDDKFVVEFVRAGQTMMHRYEIVD